MIILLYALEIIVCLFLILVILVQQGSGADLSVFGGGGTQTAFGARGATQVIHKMTVWGFVAFILLTLAIAVLEGGGTSGSVMSGVEAGPTETAAEAPAVPPADDVAPMTDDSVDEADAAPESDDAAEPMDEAGDDSSADDSSGDS